MRHFALAVALCILVVSGSGDASRTRLTLKPEPGVYSEDDAVKEVLFGREVAAGLLADRKIMQDPALNRYVNLVGQSIARYGNRPELQFFFAVVDSDEINAYAVPGGYVFITTATLEFIQNEAELAAVLAHEIAHVSDRHIVKALDIRADDESMTAMVSKIVGGNSESASVIFLQAVDHALTILFSKGLQWEDEYEADEQAVFLTAFAGYDPSAYPRLLIRLDEAPGQKRIELGKTHPPLAERVKRIDEIILNHGLVTAESSTNQKRYRQQLQEGGIDNNE